MRTNKGKYSAVENVDPKIAERAKEFAGMNRFDIGHKRSEYLKVGDNFGFLAATYAITLDAIARGL